MMCHARIWLAIQVIVCIAAERQPLFGSRKQLESTLSEMTGPHRFYFEKDNKSFFLCLMPKTACMFYLRYFFLELLPKDVSYPRMKNPFRPFRYEDPAGWYFQLISCGRASTAQQLQEMTDLFEKPGSERIVIVRDPWSRLMSGFQNKYYQDCRSDMTCFAQTFAKFLMPSITGPHMKITFDWFVKELHDFVAIHGYDTLNPHFRPQTQLCGLKNMNELYTRVIDMYGANKAITKIFTQDTNLINRTTLESYEFMKANKAKFGPPHDPPIKLNFTCTTLKLALKIYAQDYHYLGRSTAPLLQQCIRDSTSTY